MEGGGCLSSTIVVKCESARERVEGECLIRSDPFQLPRVIEGGVEVNDSREFEFYPVWHWQPEGGGLYTGVKWCKAHFTLV